MADPMSDAVLVAIIGGSFATLTVIGQALVAVSARRHTNRAIGEANGHGTLVQMWEHSAGKMEEVAHSIGGIQTWCFRHDVRDDARFSELGEKLDQLKQATDGLADREEQ